MANKPLASNATDDLAMTPEEVALLSVGQKAARTRRINAAAKAEAEVKAKADAAERLAKAIKRATETAIRTVPDPAKRAASLDKLAAEQAADAARKEAFKALLTRKEEVAAEEAAKAALPIWEIRALFVDEAASEEGTGGHYADALTRRFGDIPGGWWNAKRADADRTTNYGTLIADLFAEEKLFFDAVKDRWAVDKAIGRKVPIRPNPSRYFNMARKRAEEAQAVANGDDGKKEVKGPLLPLAAIERDLAALYIRANGHETFKKNARLRDAAFKIGSILKELLPDGKWSEVQAKAEAKAKD